MSQETLLITRPASTPTPDPRGYAYGLPPEMLRQTSFRLSLIALVYAGTSILAYPVVRFFFTPREQSTTTRPSSMIELMDLVSLAFVLFSIGVFFVARSKKIKPTLLLDLGLLFEVIGAVGIEIGILMYPEMLQTEVTGILTAGISWTCVWIVIFPLIVPATRGKALLASLGAASVVPFFVLIGLARGFPADVGNLMPYLVSTYICVGIAMVGTNVVYQLRSEVAKAHHMGSYKLVEQLGSGGMGEVWRAEHRMLARPAAIKLIRAEALGARDEAGRRELVTRFNREAQATANLSSPHTVQLYDFGVTDEGVFYYVMELLHGMDAASLVERFGPLPPERTIDLLCQVCESLSEAHDIGLIHRDIKPANVFVCKLGARYDVAKLLDFGLVKASGISAKDDTQVTLPNVATGTPAFMAPEMVIGAAEIDGRADIYAVGCVAYWLLTGELVFSEGTPMQVAFAHVNTPPEPPSRRSELEIPEALERVVMSCLEKDRENRPQTAKELGELLAAAGGENRWTQARAVQWWNDHVPDLVVKASAKAQRPQIIWSDRSKWDL